MILVPLKALGRQSELQGSQHSPSDPAAFSCPVASAPANCRAVSGTSRPGLSDLVFLVACWHSLSRTHPPYAASLHVQTCLPTHAPRRGLLPDLPGQTHRAAWSPGEVLASAAPYRAAGPWERNASWPWQDRRTMGRPNPGFPGCAPRGPQVGLAQGPSLLSDLDKPSPPPRCPIPTEWEAGQAEPQLSDFKAFSVPWDTCQNAGVQAHQGGSGLAGLGRAQESAF